MEPRKPFSFSRAQAREWDRPLGLDNLLPTRKEDMLNYEGLDVPLKRQAVPVLIALIKREKKRPDGSIDFGGLMDRVNSVHRGVGEVEVNEAVVREAIRELREVGFIRVHPVKEHNHEGGRPKLTYWITDEGFLYLLSSVLIREASEKPSMVENILEANSHLFPEIMNGWKSLSKEERNLVARAFVDSSPPLFTGVLMDGRMHAAENARLRKAGVSESQLDSRESDSCTRNDFLKLFLFWAIRPANRNKVDPAIWRGIIRKLVTASPERLERIVSEELWSHKDTADYLDGLLKTPTESVIRPGEMKIPRSRKYHYYIIKTRSGYMAMSAEFLGLGTGTIVESDTPEEAERQIRARIRGFIYADRKARELLRRGVEPPLATTRVLVREFEP